MTLTPLPAVPPMLSIIRPRAPHTSSFSRPSRNTSLAEPLTLPKRSARPRYLQSTFSIPVCIPRPPVNVGTDRCLGHSLTIVGLERRKSGSCNLLVFDPMFRPSAPIRRFIGTRFHITNPEKLLKAYRRGEPHLRKFSTFEILKLSSRLSSRRGWDLV